MKYNIAIVTPWFGKELKGGAEQLSWQLAKRLSLKDEINLEVLTTCSKSFLENWFSDHYDVGFKSENGINVRRFSVNTDNPVHFGRLNEIIINHDISKNFSPLSSHDENLFINENINSDTLVKYIKESAERYDAFIFLPYLYGPIINSIEYVKEKAIIQPCLHDEGYAYMNKIRKNFLDSSKILFNSAGEFEIAKKIYGPSIISKSVIIGSGIELLEKNFNNIKTSPIVKDDYILYIGRRDATKNTYKLIDMFEKYVLERDLEFKLVLAGVGEVPSSINESIVIDLGLVSEDEKFNLISNCKAMINPSENESFSRIIYESWFALKPVIVNKKCLATYLALKESSNSGWAFDDESSLFNSFDELLSKSNYELENIAKSGKEYTKYITSWDNIILRYIKQFDELKNSKTNKKNKTKKINDKDQRKLVQFSAGFVNGDAISEQVYYIHNLALKNNWKSEIYSEHVSLDVRNKFNIKNLEDFNLKDNDLILYHYSIGSKATEFVKKAKAKLKYMIYHNITPSSFFKKYNKEIVKVLKQGRKELKTLNKTFDKCYGDSLYNVEELKSYKFKKSSVLPLLVENKKWDYLPDKKFMRKFQNDNKKNILFVGRISPNKCHHDLIRLFEYYQNIYGDCRLILAGGYDINDNYFKEINHLIVNSKFADDIVLTGHISYEELFSCFMTADIYVSMSEHEGFGVPLVESMWFDIPVISYKSSAIPEVLGDSAVLFDDKSNLLEISALINIILTNDEIKNKIILSQRERRRCFVNLEEVYINSLFS